MKLLLNEQLKKIKLVILDVDGTLTDGGIYYDNDGHEFKKFNAKDGLGIVQTQQTGIDFMILTGRSSAIVEKRANDLKVKYLFQGIKDKAEFLEKFLTEQKIPNDTVAYVGDDLNDYDAMKLVRITACPADASPEIKEISTIILTRNGGSGAVREFTDKILLARQINKVNLKSDIQ